MILQFSMETKYLLCVKGKEIPTSGEYVPRPKDIVQVSDTDACNGMYEVYEVVNWIHKKEGTELFDAGLPRVMLVSIENKIV